MLSNTAYSDSWGQGGGGLYLSHSDANISGVAFNAGAEGGIYLAEGYITPTVVSNIVVSNTYGIRAHTNASGTLDYNDVWSNATQDYDLPGALEPGSHDIQADPLFTNPAGDDFHLQAGSPCIDAGTDAGVTSDRDFGKVMVGGAVTLPSCVGGGTGSRLTAFSPDCLQSALAFRRLMTIRTPQGDAHAPAPGAVGIDVLVISV